jgi:hypothetical protein
MIGLDLIEDVGVRIGGDLLGRRVLRGSGRELRREQLVGK